VDESWAAFDPMAVPNTIADYHDVRPLSVGGHGRFYLANPPARLGLAEDQVVVKIVPGGDDTAFRRFTRELRLYARVQSDFLVKLYDAGQVEDAFFYSMEWCTDGSLDSASGLDGTAKRRAVSDAARAAHALHEAGIVHRDIRPSNVLLRGDGTAVLSDLALAQLGTGSVTSMAPVASVGFLDPALLLGESAGRATDVYSLGATLHFALTGSHLFPGLDPSDAMLAVRTVLRQPPRIQRDALSADEADLVAACIDRNVGARPPTAAAFADLLNAAGA
jgi:eukaryotic-like serine/threonine-protein kinase